MTGSVLILTGPPGAGKSTIADILARASVTQSVHLHTDDFFDRYLKSGYVLPWLPDRLCRIAPSERGCRVAAHRDAADTWPKSRFVTSTASSHRSANMRPTFSNRGKQRGRIRQRIETGHCDGALSSRLIILPLCFPRRARRANP